MQIISKDAQGELLEIHQQLHEAMDALIKKRNYAFAQDCLRRVDERLTWLIKNAKVIDV
jgi:hypothetical protein